LQDIKNYYNNAECECSISERILNLLYEQKISPSAFIKEYKKRFSDIKSTIDFFTGDKKDNDKIFNPDNYKSGFSKKEFDISSIKKILNNENSFMLNISEKQYPGLLKQIYFPPPLLFCKGSKIKTIKGGIAVVGTRKNTAYGRDVAAYISKELSKIGITVVSGMASGIDFWAHKAAINEVGGSIGVLGCGINIVYPRENKNLYCKIIENGSIITEFIPGTPPLKKNFPARNRLISGISMGVVVVEAPERSGALITADFALEQDREVFGVPGSIFFPESQGTHHLIKNGAKLVCCIDDILNEIHQFCLFKSPNCSSEKKPSCNNSTCKRKNKNITFKNPGKQAIYNIIGYMPKTVEEISILSKLNISEVLHFIAELQLENIIQEKSLNQFVRM